MNEIFIYKLLSNLIERVIFDFVGSSLQNFFSENLDFSWFICDLKLITHIFDHDLVICRGIISVLILVFCGSSIVCGLVATLRITQCTHFNFGCSLVFRFQIYVWSILNSIIDLLTWLEYLRLLVGDNIKLDIENLHVLVIKLICIFLPWQIAILLAWSTTFSTALGHAHNNPLPANPCGPKAPSRSPGSLAPQPSGISFG